MILITHAAREREHTPHVGEPQQIGEQSLLQHWDGPLGLPCSTGTGISAHLNLGGLSYQFWRDRGKESLEEFSHLSPLQGRAVYLFIQLLNCWPEFCKLSLEKKDIRLNVRATSVQKSLALILSRCK